MNNIRKIYDLVMQTAVKLSIVLFFVLSCVNGKYTVVCVIKS